jgi:hypothetical protein
VAELERKSKEAVALKKVNQLINLSNNGNNAHGDWVTRG